MPSPPPGYAPRRPRATGSGDNQGSTSSAQGLTKKRIMKEDSYSGTKIGIIEHKFGILY